MDTCRAEAAFKFLMEKAFMKANSQEIWKLGMERWEHKLENMKAPLLMDKCMEMALLSGMITKSTKDSLKEENFMEMVKYSIPMDKK